MRNLTAKKLVIILIFSCIALIMTACEPNSPTGGDDGKNLADSGTSGVPSDNSDSDNRVGDGGGTVVKTRTPAACFVTDENEKGTIVRYENKYKDDVSGDDKECPRDVAIPDSLKKEAVTAIGEGAFQSSELTSVTIPDSVTTLGFRAFAYNKLTEVTISKGVTTIKLATFDSNELTSVTIPDSVTAIGIRAFSNNELTSVEIPASVQTIEKSAFVNNDALTKIVIDPHAMLNIIDDDAFPNDFKAKFDEHRKKVKRKEEKTETGTWTWYETRTPPEWIFAAKNP